MKIKELKKQIKGVFKQPIKQYYIGKIKYGAPYFNPSNFLSSIIWIRILKRKEPKQYQEYVERYPHFKDKPQAIYSNLPMVRRTKDWIIKLFGKDLFITIGYPIAVRNIQLGWKWKHDDIRYEWYPSFQIYFFIWQFVVSYVAPDGNNDRYYEMILWWLKKANKDIVEAEKTWGWVDMKTKESTWNKNYLL